MGDNDPDSDIVDDSQTIDEDYWPVVKKSVVAVWFFMSGRMGILLL